MLERTLLFVDTSYLLASFYNSWETGARAQLEIDLPEVVNVLGQMVQNQLDQPVHRQLWYDGIPDSGPHRYQRSLRTCEGVQLRAGHLIEWGERRTQKAVDTRLVADMVLSAARGQVSDFVLVSGDADMIPGVEEAVTAGIRVHLYGFGWDSMSSLLRHACDSTTILDPREDFAECMQLQVLEGPLPPVVRSRTTPDEAGDESGAEATSGTGEASDSCCTRDTSSADAAGSQPADADTAATSATSDVAADADTPQSSSGDTSECCQESNSSVAGATSTALGQHAKSTEEGQAGASASKGSIRRDHYAAQDEQHDSEPLKPASPQPGESTRPNATPASIPGAHARLDAEAEEPAPAMPEPKQEQPAETIDPAAEVAASTSSTPRTVADTSDTTAGAAGSAKQAEETKDAAEDGASDTSGSEAPKPSAVPKPSMMAPRRKLRSRYVPLPNEVWASAGYQTPFDVGQQYASWWYEHAATTDQRDNAHLLSGGGLPPEIDRPLLQFACETLHEYTLSETQRVSLRDGFHSGIRGVLINVSRRN